MRKLCYLKTHCIRSFVRNIKLWIKNWEFKKDVLANQLFVISSVKMRVKFDSMKLSIKNKNKESELLSGRSENL